MSGTNVERGREARTPKQIPKRGWKDILLRTKDQITEDHIDIVAAGVAFYSLLSLPFLLSAMVSLFGLLADPAEIERQMSGLRGLLPGEAHTLISEQLRRISSQPSGALTFALVGSVLLALWSGSKAAKSLITALNIVYDEKEKRNFLFLTATAIGLTLLGVVGAIVAILLVAGIPAVVGRLGLPDTIESLATYARWPVLVLGALLGLAVLYRFAPSREKAQWRWVSWGSAFATALWITASALFSVYVSTVAKYNETYGSLGAVVVLLLWAYVSAFIVLLGAELNSEMEHQTEIDTTTGEPLPMGERGAEMADTVGEAREEKRKKSA